MALSIGIEGELAFTALSENTAVHLVPGSAKRLDVLVAFAPDHDQAETLELIG